MNFIGDFVGSPVIINFIEPNVANRRGVLIEANEIFVRLETTDGKKLLVPWSAISYISMEE